MQAATTQKAAWEGSPGTSSSKGWRRDRRRRTVSPSALTSTSAPQADSISSVWARVRTCSRTTVSPSAPRPASSTAPFTWALATGGSYSMPRRWPPWMVRGGRQPPGRQSTAAPMRRSGSATRSMGRCDTESSPTSTVSHGKAAQNPDSRRMVVPELPTSMGTSDSHRRSVPPVTRSPSTSAPRQRTARAVRATSSPPDSPRRVEVPSARAARIRARWEMDLSPGTRTRPRSGLPPVTSRVVTPGGGGTAGSPGPTGRP